ncbi:MAG: hypothetical protein ABSF61_14120 [Anaerolineales bacterium]
MRITLSLAQFDVQTGKARENLESARSPLTEVAKRGSDPVLLPEPWLSGYDLRNGARYASPLRRGIFK